MKRSCPNAGPFLRLLVVAGLLFWLASAAVAQDPAPAPESPSVDLPAPDTNAAAAPGTETPATAPAEGPEIKADSTLEDLFANYLHFALVGQFDVADRYGQALLKHPQVSPQLTKEGGEQMLALSEKYRNSIETLLLMINNTPIAENAKKVLEIIRQSHAQARMNPQRITENIKLLAGTPMQYSVGLERLVESGEYAVPWMIDVLADPRQQNLQPFVVRALPALGKKAVNPLVVALSIKNPAVQGVVAQALGRIGYPQALPYLARLAEDPQTNSAVRDAAVEAIQQIVVADPGVKARPAAELFQDLAEKYYANIESLQPDPREDRANVWVVQETILKPIEVPREIYQYVMAMETAQASLAINREQPAVIALWLAANFHREAELGLDVASGAPAQTNDLTRPQDFPRSIYFARTAGPRYSQMALGRAVHDRDAVVALGSIAALHVTAGPATMVEPEAKEGISLAAALSFPDVLVRIRAALALGQALPQEPFRDAREVVPVLASALQLTGQKVYVVADPVEATRKQIAGDLERGGATVFAAERFGDAMEAAHRKVSHVDGIFITSDIQRPNPVEAVRALAGDSQFALAPVVMVVKPDGTMMIERVAAADKRVGTVLMTADNAGGVAEQLLARRGELATEFGGRELSPEVSVALALESARTLRDIAVNRSPVFDIAGAESSLILALAHPSEELRIASAGALALIDSAPAQRAIATVALNPQQTETLRTAAYGALAESARRFGSKLEPPAMEKLFNAATTDPNLPLRTAASQALGAMNPPGRPVADIILSQPGA